ncbi:hypothetical protein EV2_024415 [Malus domestica]
MEPRSFERKWNIHTTTSNIKRHGWVTWRNMITRVDNTPGGRSNDCMESATLSETVTLLLQRTPLSPSF